MVSLSNHEPPESASFDKLGTSGIWRVSNDFGKALRPHASSTCHREQRSDAEVPRPEQGLLLQRDCRASFAVTISTKAATRETLTLTAHSWQAVSSRAKAIPAGILQGCVDVWAHFAHEHQLGENRNA